MSFPVFKFSVWYLLLTPIYLLLTPISLLFTPNPIATNFPVWYSVRSERMEGVGWGGVGYHGWRGGVLVYVQTFKRACILTCQIDSQLRIPVRLHIPQRNGESSSKDHMWVRSCNCDLDLTIYPPPYVKNGFVLFQWHGSTQLWEYVQSFPPYHSIDRNKKRWKVFPSIFTVLTVLVFINSLPLTQERCNWIILVETHVSVYKFGVNYGFSLLIP